ncbi:LysR family transcriptional regulator [Stackebrandtia nassauensis]|uniref:Transcriptional regulator, LysR family n=1 Tax=Stackebrandtia nassauensis (strain DSM 44728 / CIP 108903 / NRRL B-16338 / NBRC 102104 / LLR-40K-21) TaxID=446470 RepID=D3QBX0_STANL|nr:LysR substrate-binding domain-containing protein [Stackebrandtia nassauensis]ADD44859.1 transcriptional regulator, LysR family [Stackebrandtia nassauensis DSM 44728]
MQLPQLKSFVTVCDTRHFTRAAELLHVAQPSLSQQIKALEHELGTPLFRRARGNITPTDAGAALLPVARRILADTELAYREVADTVDLRRGRVRLGAPPSLCASLVPDIFRVFHDRYPGVELTVDEGGSQDLVRTLTDGELDLALIITHQTGRPAALRVAELLHENLVVASAPQLPPPGKRARITVADLRDQPLVMFRRGYDLRESTITACREAGFEPTFTVEGGEMDAVLGFVRAGLGLAVVPSMVAERSGLRITRFTRSGPERTIAIAHRRDVQPPRAARELHRMLLEHLRSADANGELPPETTLLAEAFAPAE